MCILIRFILRPQYSRAMARARCELHFALLIQCCNNNKELSRNIRGHLYYDFYKHVLGWSGACLTLELEVSQVRVQGCRPPVLSFVDRPIPLGHRVVRIEMFKNVRTAEQCFSVRQNVGD